METVSVQEMPLNMAVTSLWGVVNMKIKINSIKKKLLGVYSYQFFYEFEINDKLISSSSCGLKC